MELWKTSKVHPEVFGEYWLSGPDMKDDHTVVYKNTRAGVFLISPSKYGRWCIHGDSDPTSIALLCSNSTSYFDGVERPTPPQEFWGWKFSMMTANKLEWHLDPSFKVLSTLSLEHTRKNQEKDTFNALLSIILLVILLIIMMSLACWVSSK